MDYGRIIRTAWATTWHCRFLWVLGLFATSSLGLFSLRQGGGPARYQLGPSDLARVGPAAEQAAQAATRWLEGHMAAVAALALLFVGLGMAFVVIDLIAEGAMAQATADLARGMPSSLGRAWRAGRRLFWRYAGLWLLFGGGALLVATAIAVVVLVAAGALGAPGAPAAPWPEVVALTLVVVPTAGACLVGMIAASILFAFAQRAIAVDDVGPLTALGQAWSLLRTHFAASLLGWLVQVALAIGAGVGVVIVGGLLVAVLVAIGAGLVALGGLAWPIVAALALIALAGWWLLGAIANTFFWTYWTLLFLQLRQPVAA